jgi:hypothetical protein
MTGFASALPVRRIEGSAACLNVDNMIGLGVKCGAATESSNLANWIASEDDTAPSLVSRVISAIVS